VTWVAGWLVSLENGFTAAHGEADEYGISSLVPLCSFLSRSRKPFPPNRLYNFLTKDLGLCLAHDWNAGHMTNKKKNRTSQSPKNFMEIFCDPKEHAG